MARERIDLAGVFPAVFEQSMKPVCVAAAVAGLVEFYEGFREPLSVEFLDDAMMRQRKAWAEENLARLRRGEDGDAIWEDLYRKQLLQIRFVGRKTAFDSPEAEHLIALFEANIRERLLDADGATIAGAFGVLRERGICAERLWPYASAPHSAFSTVPPDAEDDAMHRRFGARELYLLKTPGNVEEVKRILAGANGNRPMPVAAILETFGECADGVFAMPGADAAAQGRHAVLVTGFDADGFTFRNSWGAKWGRRGYGRMGFDYFTRYCAEAGTILARNAECDVQGYGAMRRGGAERGRYHWWLNLLFAALFLCAGAAAAFAWLVAHAPKPPPHHRIHRHSREGAAEVQATQERNFTQGETQK